MCGEDDSGSDGGGRGEGTHTKCPMTNLTLSSVDMCYFKNNL